MCVMESAERTVHIVRFAAFHLHLHRRVRDREARAEHTGDALDHLEETHALHPLPVQPREKEEVPETYPTGV